MAHGSAAAWGHLNLLGEYDFRRTSCASAFAVPPLTKFVQRHSGLHE
jgi:hypothetical protein